MAKKTGENVYPGMMFGLAKERMERTKLWQIVRKMPKGALLHAHLDAMVDLDFIFGALLGTPGMHVYCERSLSDPAALEFPPIRFKYLKSEHSKYPFAMSLSRLISHSYRNFDLEPRLYPRHANSRQ